MVSETNSQIFKIREISPYTNGTVKLEVRIENIGSNSIKTTSDDLLMNAQKAIDKYFCGKVSNFKLTTPVMVFDSSSNLNLKLEYEVSVDLELRITPKHHLLEGICLCQSDSLVKEVVIKAENPLGEHYANIDHLPELLAYEVRQRFKDKFLSGHVKDLRVDPEKKVVVFEYRFYLKAKEDVKIEGLKEGNK